MRTGTTAAGCCDSIDGLQIKLCRFPHKQKGLGSNYALNKLELLELRLSNVLL